MSRRLLIADSGPLIALARLDLLALPKRYFHEIVVSSTVWREVSRRPRPRESERLQAALVQSNFVVSDAAGSITQRLADARLDAGERHTLALGLALESTVLIDERRGRHIARELALPVLGTLGLLVLGRQSGVIPAVKPLIDELQGSGYYLSDALVESVLSHLEER